MLGAREDLYQFAKFVAVSALSAAATLYARHLLNVVLVFEAAVMGSHVIGTIIAFTLNRLLVFGGGASPLLQYGRFLVVNAMSFVITTIVSALFYRVVLPAIGFAFHTELTAHLIGLGSSAVPAYLGHRYFSFREWRSAGTSPR